MPRTAPTIPAGSLLKPAVWRHAKKNAIKFEFAQNYNGPGRWKYGLGFVIGFGLTPAQALKPNTFGAGSPE
jgi:hypothetical protein